MGRIERGQAQWNNVLNPTKNPLPLLLSSTTVTPSNLELSAGEILKAQSYKIDFG